MRISRLQLKHYHELGFLFIEGCFSEKETEIINSQIPALFACDSPARIMENDKRTVRSVFGAHTTNEVMYKLAHHPRLVEPATQMLEGNVYIHQFKINAKAAITGGVWNWHQDFIFWLREDGMIEPQAVTAALFLDEVTEYNGPIRLIPRSHHFGTIDTPPRDTAPDWTASVIADLKYSLSSEDLAPLVASNGIVEPKGPQGSVLFFHCNLVHGSAPNISPSDRKIAFVTFNSTANTLGQVAAPRPDFLANRDYTPTCSVDEDALLNTEPADITK